MYKHHINTMVNDVLQGLNKSFKCMNNLTVKESLKLEKVVRAGIEKEWKDKIAVAWDVYDVIGRTKECYSRSLSRKNAMIILDDIMSHNDAEDGISWITIDWGIEKFFDI